MSTKTLGNSIFWTRDETADLLNMCKRSVDLLAKRGDITKVKLGPSKSAIMRDSVIDYMARMNASASPAAASASSGASLPMGAPIGSIGLSFRSNDGGMVGHLGKLYGSRMRSLCIHSESADAKLGQGIDDWLSGNGYPGCIVLVGDAAVTITWAASIGYQFETIRDELQRVKGAAMHLALA